MMTPDQTLTGISGILVTPDPAANALIGRMRVLEDRRAQELNGAAVSGIRAALIAPGHDCGQRHALLAWSLTAAQQSDLAGFLAATDLN